MSSWMTSGKARLNARQNRTFEKRAQQRARVMTANNGTGSGTSEPQRILRERISHPNANYQTEAVRGTKRHRSGNIEIISGERAKAKYSPNNPIRRRGVVATARRIQNPHSLDQHHQWQSHLPHGSEYHPHAPPPPYHSNRSEYHYYGHHHQQHPHQHRYPAHGSGEEHSQRYHSRRRDASHLESHHYPEHAQYRAAPYFPPTAGRQAMTYDYKTARWVPCRHPPPPPHHHHQHNTYEPPPPDPIKEAQVYPSAHDPLLDDYQQHDPRGYPSRLDHPKPPFQGRQLPHHFQQRSSANDWESNNRSKHDDGDDNDYLFYGDHVSVNLETQASFEMPSGNENILDDPHHHHSSRQHHHHHHLYDNMDNSAGVQDHHQHNVYSNDDSDVWHSDPPLKLPVEPPRLQYDHHHHHDGYQELESPPGNDFPEVNYSKSEMEPWDAGATTTAAASTDHQFQIERSNTWSPGHSTSSAAEPQSFTLRRTSSSRGRRRISRYVPPRLPYSPPRLPAEGGGGGGGLPRFQKKRRTIPDDDNNDTNNKTTAKVEENDNVKEGASSSSLSNNNDNSMGAGGPRFFNNGVQINEDGTPLLVAAPSDESPPTE